MRIFQRDGEEVDDYVDLLEEAVPALGYSLNPLILPFGDFECGEETDGAATLLSMASTAGIRLSDHAMADIEATAKLWLQNDDKRFRPLADNILYHIERIRALDELSERA